MCGIAGILDWAAKNGPSADLLLRMISILRHRGPDESGVYLDETIQMGQARLSIIGLEGGGQPISNEDETLWIVYNGEVFNYIELRANLEKRGHRFYTDTDTEVVVHLYEEMGPDCLSELNGQFAIAIWDSRKRELFLARDRVGICPLYYTLADGRLIFASEIKAIFLDPAVTREIDMQSLAQVFTCWTTIGERTIFKDVFELCPGHYMRIKENQGPPIQRPYWQIPYYGPGDRYKGSREEAAEELACLLEDAVRLRLRADVPVGAYLSGGLDSSAITSIISNKFNNRLRTFSIGFEEKSFDEAPFQADMVKYLGTDHQQTFISNNQVREFFPKVLWHAEKPLLRTSPVPLFMLSKLVRDHRFKVVLTGEGADEVFGGYNIFKEAKVRAFWARQPESKIRPLLLERLYPYIFDNPARARAFLQKFFRVNQEDVANPLMSHQKRWENTEWCTTFFHSERLAELGKEDVRDNIRAKLPSDFAERDLLSRAQWLEMAVFMSNYLLTSQGDRVAMANAVEVRPPFLDHRVMDFAARLPAAWKINGLNEKYLLKKAFSDRLPAQIVSRPKQPYRAPIGQAFFTQPGEKINDLVSIDRLERAGIFNPQKVKNLLGKYLKKGQGPSSETQNMAVVGILSTQLIYDQFVDGFAAVQQSTHALQPDKVVKRNGRGEVTKTIGIL